MLCSMHPQRLVLALAVGIGVALNSRVRVHGTGSGELDSATKETSLHQRQGDVTATNVLSRPVPNASHVIVSRTAHIPAWSPFEPRTTDTFGLGMGAHTLSK